MRQYHKEQAKKEEEKKKKEKEAKKAGRKNSSDDSDLSEELKLDNESNDSSSKGSQNLTPPKVRNSKQIVKK